MTVSPIPPIIAMLDAAEITAPVSARLTDTTVPRIRLDQSGGLDDIPGLHDQALVEVWCFASTFEAADELAREVRAALAVGLWGSAVVTKVRTSPPRFEDGDEFEPPQGVVRFTARVWLHGA